MHKTNPFKHFLLIPAITFTGLVSFAQGPFGENVLPDPLKPVERSFYPLPQKGLKSMVYLHDRDTVSKSFYDKNGNEILKLDEFRKNGPLYRSVYSYTDNLKTETVFYVNDIVDSKTSFKYSNRNLVEWKRMKAVTGKQVLPKTFVLDVHWLIAYNKYNKITSAYSVDAANVKNQVYEYSYDLANRLARSNENQWQDRYDYQGNLIIKKIRIFKNDNSIYDSSSFKYNEDGLLAEVSGKYYNTQYGYEARKLKTLTHRRRSGSSEVEINFFYNKDNLVKAEMNTNDISFSPPGAGFYFKSDPLSSSWKRNEVNKLTLEFLYDKKQNITEIRHSINGVYKYSKTFLFTYY